MKSLLIAFLITSGISFSLLTYSLSADTDSDFDMHTRDYQPVCNTSPGTYVDFVYFLELGNSTKVNEFISSGKCGFVKEGIPAMIVEEGDGWVKVLLANEDRRYIIFTSPDSLGTGLIEKMKGKILEKSNTKFI